MAVPKQKPTTQPPTQRRGGSDARRAAGRDNTLQSGPQRTHQSTDEQWNKAAQNRTTTGLLFGSDATHSQGSAPSAQDTERRQHRPSASITPGTPAALEQARQNNRRARRVDPNSVRVSRKKQAAQDPRHRATIDEIRDAEAAEAGTGAQLLKERNKKTKRKLAAKVVQNATPWGRALSVGQHVAQKRKLMKMVAKRRGSIKGIAKVARGTIMASASIFTLYLFQLAFGIVGLVGLMAGTDPQEDDLLTQLIYWVANIFGISEILFSIGFIFSLVIGIISFVFVGAAYFTNGMNPFEGKGLIGFIFSFILIPMSIGLLPGAYFWIAFIFYEHSAPEKVSE